MSVGGIGGLMGERLQTKGSSEGLGVHSNGLSDIDDADIAIFGPFWITINAKIDQQHRKTKFFIVLMNSLLFLVIFIYIVITITNYT